MVQRGVINTWQDEIDKLYADVDFDPDSTQGKLLNEDRLKALGFMPINPEVAGVIVSVRGLYTSEVGQGIDPSNRVPPNSLIGKTILRNGHLLPDQTTAFEAIDSL